MTGEDQPLSAEVVLRGGASATPARQWFERRGFAATEVAGISFSITAGRALFDDTFGVRLGEPGSAPGVDVLELPMPDLPADVANAVEAVTFSAPPDFGPPSY